MGNSGFGKRLPIESANEQKRVADMMANIRDFSAFSDEIVLASIWMSAGLEQSKMDPPKPEDRKRIKDSLDSFASTLEAARNALVSLDGVPRDEIYRRAGGRKQDWRTEGTAAVEAMAKSLEKYTVWAHEASSLYKGKKGRPPNFDADAAMSELIDIWERQTGERPTIPTNFFFNRK